MVKVNTLCLKRSEYKSNEDFEMEIGKVTFMLLRNEYILKTHEEDFEVFVIEYETKHADWGCPYPYWLTPEEADSVIWEDEREE